MTRYGLVIKVLPEKLEEYKRLHANVPADVQKATSECHLTHYSIYYMPEGYLFAYYDYTGDDYAADMEKMKTYPCMQAWWKLTDPCQKAVDSAKKGEWWSIMEEVFHQE
jgi:L-rhamnose mutarotase